jgi:thioredoxin-like negative regulator of GroEL
MIHLMLNLLLQAAAVAGPARDYTSAYYETERTGRPLVVLIGADWCPGCQQMKQSAIPELEKKGGLKKVSFAYVNSDHQSSLAGKLMQGSSIPQLIMFHKTESGWIRQQMTGAHSVSDIQAFLAQAVEPNVDRLSSTK